MNKDNRDDVEVEVLYQKLGDRWYAFSLIDDEVFVGTVPSEDLGAPTATKTVRREKGNA